MKAAPTGRASSVCALTALLVLAGAQPALARFGTQTLRVGSRGHDVKVLQSWLSHLGYDTTIDGAFGRATARSERRFERHEQLPVDGVASVSDESAMRKAMQQLSSGTSDPTGTTPGARARLSSDGHTAVAPADAPQQVRDVIAVSP